MLDMEICGNCDLLLEDRKSNCVYFIMKYYMSFSNDYVCSTITLFDYIFHREGFQLPKHYCLVE